LPAPKHLRRSGGAGIQDTKAALGHGRKITLQSAGNLWAASFRVANLGLLWEFTFRIGEYAVQITSDHLAVGGWFLPPGA
jgi:hypothetical protein